MHEARVERIRTRLEPVVRAPLPEIAPANGRLLLSLQRSAGNRAVTSLVQRVEKQRAASTQAHAERTPKNETGLPASLKDGVESLAGISLDGVRVHYNSSLPTQVGASAYAQGTEIYLGPGQQQHLAHEAWHVVQQKQGRVRPTLRLTSGIALNDDARLEDEADAMGTQASQIGSSERRQIRAQAAAHRGEPVVQGMFEGLLGWLSAKLGWGSQPQANAPAPAVPVTAPVAAVPVPALGAQAAAVPAQTPATILARLLAAERVFTEAARLLPRQVTNRWPQPGEPSFLEARLRPVYRNLHGRQAFADANEAQTAGADATDSEQRAREYDDYCTAIRPHLERMCDVRDKYLQHLAPEDVARFAAVCSDVAAGTPADVARTRQACNSFVQLVAAKSSDGLYQLMTTPGSRPTAARLVGRYFADKRLRIGNWRAGFASEFDRKRLKFGAELTLRAPDPLLRDIAENWVFHTHAQSDESRETFTISRAQDASHIKRIEDRLETGLSLSFVDEAEFARAERDDDVAKSFRSWVRRTAGEALRNVDKRQ
jgi:hypothetical protein